jgi:hypothetical protein
MTDMFRGVLTHPSIRTGEEAFGLLSFFAHAAGDSSGASTRATQNKTSPSFVIPAIPVRSPVRSQENYRNDEDNGVGFERLTVSL